MSQLMAVAGEDLLCWKHSLGHPLPSPNGATCEGGSAAPEPPLLLGESVASSSAHKQKQQLKEWVLLITGRLLCQRKEGDFSRMAIV